MIFLSTPSCTITPQGRATRVGTTTAVWIAFANSMSTGNRLAGADPTAVPTQIRCVAPTAKPTTTNADSGWRPAAKGGKSGVHI